VTRLISLFIGAALLVGCRDSSIRRAPGDPVALLEFRVEAASANTPGVLSFPDPGGHPLLLRPEVVIRNADISSVEVEESEGRFSVGLRFIPSAAARLERETASNVGRRMAVLLDGKVVVAPLIRSAISSQARIDAHLTRDEAFRIARSLAPPAA
jgi:preprotein translocase subunit SecD